MKKTKHAGSSFKDYILENLKEDDHAVFLHIRDALEDPDIKDKGDYIYLIKAINDVASARGKGNLAEKAGLSRQGLHKILNGESVPSFENVVSILKAIGLQFSVQQIEKTLSNETPASVLDVADYAEKRLSRDSTYMKLQKIVYYAQVESLVHYGTPLFAENTLAWRGGPVVRELFEKHRGYKVINNVKLGDSSNLSLEQTSCIDWAIKKYGKLDGDTLSHLTHLEEPWIKARKGLSSDAASEREITTESMKSYYSTLPKYQELEEQDLTED